MLSGNEMAYIFCHVTWTNESSLVLRPSTLFFPGHLDIQGYGSSADATLSCTTIFHFAGMGMAKDQISARHLCYKYLTLFSVICCHFI